MDDKVREIKRDYGEQDENGVDLAAIRRNLRLTPTERIEKMCATLAVLRGYATSPALDDLLAAGIPFVIVGDFALGYYDPEMGCTTAEICIPDDNSIVMAVLQLAEKSHMTVHFGSAGGLAFDKLAFRAVQRAYGDAYVSVASLDDLIDMKKAAGRVKDQLHLLELEAIRKILGEQGDAGA